MKYIVAILFALIIVFSSCSKDSPEIEKPWECLPCSHYYGSFNGDIQIPTTGLDTSFTNTQTVLEITEGLNDSVNVEFDFSGFFGSPIGSNLIEFNQAYWVDSTITGQTAIYSGTQSVYYDLEAANSFKYQVLEGTITLSGDVNGTLTFVSIR